MPSVRGVREERGAYLPLLPAQVRGRGVTSPRGAESIASSTSWPRAEGGLAAPISSPALARSPPRPLPRARAGGDRSSCATAAPGAGSTRAGSRSVALRRGPRTASRVRSGRGRRTGPASRSGGSASWRAFRRSVRAACAAPTRRSRTSRAPHPRWSRQRLATPARTSPPAARTSIETKPPPPPGAARGRSWTAGRDDPGPPRTAGRCAAADGNRCARSGFHQHAPPRQPTATTRNDSCEWPDSNRHGVTHWYLKPARLPIPPHSRDPSHVARRTVLMP